MLNRRCATGLITAIALLGGTVAAHAQSYPAKPIRWVVPYPAGGGSDFLARTIGQQLSQQISQPVTVDNKPGGNTAIAASEVARSAADGYTILSADNGTMVFNTALYSKLTYNPEKDLAPVTLMGRFPMILVVGPNSDVKDALSAKNESQSVPGRLARHPESPGLPRVPGLFCFRTSRNDSCHPRIFGGIFGGPYPTVWGYFTFGVRLGARNGADQHRSPEGKTRSIPHQDG